MSLSVLLLSAFAAFGAAATRSGDFERPSSSNHEDTPRVPKIIRLKAPKLPPARVVTAPCRTWIEEKKSEMAPSECTTSLPYVLSIKEITLLPAAYKNGTEVFDAWEAHPESSIMVGNPFSFPIRVRRLERDTSDPDVFRLVEGDEMVIEPHTWAERYAGPGPIEPELRLKNLSPEQFYALLQKHLHEHGLRFYGEVEAVTPWAQEVIANRKAEIERLRLQQLEAEKIRQAREREQQIRVEQEYALARQAREQAAAKEREAAQQKQREDEQRNLLALRKSNAHREAMAGVHGLRRVAKPLVVVSVGAGIASASAFLFWKVERDELLNKGPGDRGDAYRFMTRSEIVGWGAAGLCVGAATTASILRAIANRKSAAADRLLVGVDPHGITFNGKF